MGTSDILKKITKLVINSIQKIKNASKYKLLIAAYILFRIYSLFKTPTFQSQLPKVIPISDLLSSLNLTTLKQVMIRNNTIISIDIFNNIEKSFINHLPKTFVYSKLQKYKNIIINLEKQVSPNKFIEFLIYFILPFFATLAIILITKGGLFEGYTTKKKKNKPNSKVKFNDIIGLNQCKQTLRQNVQFFFKPQKYQRYGARMRKGILLYGPPGTGKTTLAKACANQAKVSFFSCNAAQFCEIYVGMGPKKVRDLFSKAKQQSPSIIYIDQLDAFGSRAQGSGMYDNANSQKNSTINQILSQLDGFESSEQVLVIGSTNRLQMVDPSLIRAGRFDVKIFTPLPNIEERVLIAKHYLQNKIHKINDEFLYNLIKCQNNWSGAQIETLINQSVYQSIKKNHEQIQEQDLKVVQDRMMKNYKRSY